MNIYILDKAFQKVGIIDSFSSAIWRPAFYTIGDFEIYLDASSKVVSKISRDYYLVREQDIHKVNDEEIYRNVMIIKNITIETDAEDGDHLLIAGKELKYMLHQRIVWGQKNISGNAESAIRELVMENAISPTNIRRKIPTLVLDEAVGFSLLIEKQITGTYLDETIEQICTLCLFGWEIFVKNDSLIFRMYQGTDRSYTQTDRNYVLFSDAYANIENSKYEMNSENYANTALIFGEGEGTSRASTIFGDEYEGLERYEHFVDASGVSRNQGTSEEITLETYLSLLEESGMNALIEKIITEGFSAEVLSGYNFKFNEHYFLGDLVTVESKYGISKDVLVLSSIEVMDEQGISVIPQLNI